MFTLGVALLDLPLTISSESNMNAPNYRLWIILALLRVFVVPPLIVIFLYQIGGDVSFRVISFLVVLSIPISIVVRSQLDTHLQHRQARQLGAKPITCVVGKLPGNIDIMFGMVKAFKEGYVMEGFSDLFEKHHSNILNTRILWNDQVRSSLSSDAI